MINKNVTNHYHPDGRHDLVIDYQRDEIHFFLCQQYAGRPLQPRYYDVPAMQYDAWISFFRQDYLTSQSQHQNCRPIQYQYPDPPYSLQSL